MWVVADINMNIIRAFDFESDAVEFASCCCGEEEVSLVFDETIDASTYKNEDE